MLSISIILDLCFYFIFSLTIQIFFELNEIIKNDIYLGKYQFLTTIQYFTQFF